MRRSLSLAAALVSVVMLAPTGIAYGADADTNEAVPATDTYVDTESLLLPGYAESVGIVRPALEQEEEVLLELDIVNGDALAAPDESTIPTRVPCPEAEAAGYPSMSACGSSSTPPAAKTPVTGQVQQQATWCGPASASSAMTAYGRTVTQTTFAGDMGTSPTTGTRTNRIPAALNRHQRFNPYQWSGDVANPATLMRRTMLDVWNYASDPILPGSGQYVPWWQEHGATGYHFFTVYGYYTQNGSGVYVWDPLSQAWAGKHKESAYDAWNAEVGYDTDRGGNFIELVW